MTGTVSEALAAIGRGVDALLSTDLSGLSDEEMTALVTGLEAQRRRLDGVDHRLVGQLGDRQLAGRYGRASTADLLVRLLRVSPGEAKARVAQAADLGPRRSLQGEPLPPLLPAAAAAVTAGEISTEQVAVITRAVDRVPPGAPLAAAQVVESTLVAAARAEHPGQLARTAQMLLARLDPDGLEPQIREQQRRREVSLTVAADGSGRLHGRLTAELAAKWTAILDATSAPAGEHDTRSAAQRRHDGLGEVADRILRSGTLAPAGGVPVTVLVTTTAQDLARRDCGGVAVTDRGAIWPVGDLLTSCAEAALTPVNTDPAGAVLALGRTRRLASRGQRLALHARDHGCSFPGCDRPAPWCEVHHVTPWQAGGTTDLDNMTLLCRYHHRHLDQLGWQVRIRHGVPEWTPPPWIDPGQRPVRNTTHHPPDLTFNHPLAELTDTG